ncbi:MAG: COX15/CtaA family protein [Propionivibrio sp.]|nr:COX15/CtaA family protein [Propionivibrio sp.]MBP6711570.1 COX15/CtaA family protein [Propionivibrio sp.]MBP7525343.1 COX15/CtaA family protein [Propionivibrio sp.]
MRFFRPLVLIATILALGVIALGAYVRLKDAGLGCPDWPGCYGHLLGVPDAPHELAKAEQHFPESPVVVAKAWTEMAHRYLAGTLGLLIAAIAFLAWKHGSALKQSPALPIALVGVVFFQALLGMWTVTLLLKPAVVTAHLLGGMTTLALLLWLLHSSADSSHTAADRYPVSESRHGNEEPAYLRGTSTPSIRTHAALALLTVIVQIALGGWVSTNYAALACTDFPTCNGVWLPEMDFSHAYRIVRELGQTADGEPLSYAALTAIHWTHRLGALVVTLVAGSLAARLLMSPAWRRWGMLLGVALLAQITLGISAVLFFLPLSVAVAHNAGAAVLLSITLAVNLKLASSSRAWQRIGVSREAARYEEVVHE